MLLPRLNIRNKSEGALEKDNPDFSLNDCHVNISHGELITGSLCKKTLGPSAGGLVHLTWMEHGPDATRALINNIQWSVTHWLLQNGFSIGIGDAVADGRTMEKIKDVISAQKDEVAKIVQQYQKKSLEADPGLTLLQTFEKAVNQVGGGGGGFVSVMDHVGRRRRRRRLS